MPELRRSRDQAISLVDRPGDARIAQRTAGQIFGLALPPRDLNLALSRRTQNAEIIGCRRPRRDIERASARKETATGCALTGLVVRPEVRRARSQLARATAISGHLRTACARPVAGHDGSRNHGAVAHARRLGSQTRSRAKVLILSIPGVLCV